MTVTTGIRRTTAAPVACGKATRSGIAPGGRRLCAARVNPRLRTTLVALAACALAAFLGSELAEGSYFLSALAAVVIVSAILIRLTGLAADTILLGLVLIGYFVGNRGFAQLMPAPGIPLLPAEGALLIACSWQAIQCAFERTLPFQRDALNWAVLAWLLAGTVRVGFDVPRYGLLALRDYAQVYYAVFFFLAQHMARNPAAGRYLVGCLRVASLVLLPVYVLYLLFPQFFLNQLTVSGVPLVFYKGDIVVTFLAIGAVLLFHQATGHQRYWAWPFITAMLLLVLAGGNRASLLGLLIVSGLLLLARRWRWPLFLGALAGGALLGLVGLATIFDHTWSQQKLSSLSDQATSIVDVTGSRRYESTDSYNKGDNNRFRLVWWRNVAEETWNTNPLLGLGFGADLARGFVQEYYPETDEEFTTRSPHNVFLTVFARMGAVGLVIWLVFVGLLLRNTWRSLRFNADPVNWSLWCGAGVVLVSAAFGVVLEGPMGAVVFWTMLGLANARSSTTPVGSPAVAAVKDLPEPVAGPA